MQVHSSFLPHFRASLLLQLDTTVFLETNFSFVMRAKLGLLLRSVYDVRETLHESNRSELNDSISKCSPEKESFLEYLKDLLQFQVRMADTFGSKIIAIPC